ncbi:MAG: NAD+ synthase [Verrucomicrobia bacterium]|nr:NAD+ synthase [Verrucomicrobiota bacterium]
MKIALVQINTTVGALQDNVRAIREGAARAKALGAGLAVFHELTITGYPPKDLLEKRWFVDGNLAALDELAASSVEIPMVVGYVDRNPSNEGKRLLNGAALLAGGRIVSRHHKSLLPTYDVFDEGRYFEPAPAITPAVLDGHALGIAICEDIWNDKDFFNTALYHDDPPKQLVGAGAEVIVSLNASPFSIGKRALKLDMLRAIATKYGRPVVYVNQVGGNDDLIFDGASFVMDAQGRIVAQAKEFDEDIVLFDTDTGMGDVHETESEDLPRVLSALALGVRDYITKCAFTDVVIGLSGGIDSALTAAIAVEALGPAHVHGVSMPSEHSSRHSIDDAVALARNLGIDCKEIPIKPIMAAFLETFADEFRGLPNDITEENLQARIRGSILMALSNKHGWLVLNTGNKSEVSVGYCTLYGDMVGGIGVIGDVPKTTVYKLSRHINRMREIIPESTITKPPSAELRPDQKDTDSLPEYDVLDPILRAYIEEGKGRDEIIAAGHDRALVQKIIRLVDHNEYKRRQAALVLKVSNKAFGTGRRMPIACRIQPFEPAVKHHK